MSENMQHDRQVCQVHAHQSHHHHHHHPPVQLAHSLNADASDAYETANREHFDAISHQYDEQPGAQRRAQIIGRAIINTGLIKQGITTVMDFACGTGLISRILAAEDPKSIVGVDISQGMVDQYNKIVSDHGIPPEEMRAICATLPTEKLEGMSFDVIVCVAAYHHFTSIDDVTQTIVSTYLKPEGSLIVVDLVRGDSTGELFPDEVHHIVAHRGGLTEQDMRSTFEKAGLKNVTFEIITGATHAGHAVDLFLARGDK